MFFKCIGVAVILSAVSSVTMAASEVVFSCDTEDGQQTVLEYNKNDNRFIMSRGVNAITPDVTVVKDPNNMGTNYNASRTENFTQREVYVIDGDVTYILGYSEQGIKESGFVQIMEDGTQTSYQDCKPVTFHTRFNNYNLFNDMTNVD